MSSRMRSLAWYWFVKGFAAAASKVPEAQLKAAFDQLWREIKESSERGRKS